MPGIDKGALKAAWTVFLFVFAVYLLYTIGHTMVVFMLAVFLAHLLGSIVTTLEKIAPHGISRNTSLVVVFLLLIGATFSIVIPIAASAGQQAATLAANLPAALGNDPLARIPLPIWLESFRPRLTEALLGQVSTLDETIAPLLRRIGSGVLSGLGNLLAAILIPILSFYMIKDGHLIRNAILSTVKPARRLVLMDILDDMHVLLAQYIRAIVMLATTVFLAYSAFFAATGVPYALLLATLSAALEIIPVAGPLVASVAILAVAVVTGYPHVVWVLVFLIIFRLLQDYVVSPYLMSAGIAIHPLLVLFAVLAGEQIAGIPGMFFAVPMMAAFRIVFVRLREEATANNA